MRSECACDKSAERRTDSALEASLLKSETSSNLPTGGSPSKLEGFCTADGHPPPQGPSQVSTENVCGTHANVVRPQALHGLWGRILVRLRTGSLEGWDAVEGDVLDLLDSVEACVLAGSFEERVCGQICEQLSRPEMDPENLISLVSVLAGLEPDSAPMKCKSDGAEFVVCFANVTLYNAKATKWLLDNRYVHAGLAETHLSKEVQAKALVDLGALGLQAYGCQGATTLRGGCSGGLMSVAPKHRNVRHLLQFLVDGCGFLAVVLRTVGVDVVLVTIYLKCVEGLHGPTNSEILASLVSFVRTLDQPWIVGGDFNVSPEAVSYTHLRAHET